MNLYEIKWYIYNELVEAKEEAYWSESELTDRWNKKINGLDDIIRYEYKLIKEINLPNLLWKNLQEGVMLPVKASMKDM